MKKLFILLFAMTFAAPIWAQTVDDIIEVERSILKTERKVAVAEAMNFTEEEASIFWPLYNEYTTEVYKIQAKRVKIIKDFADSFETLNDISADDLMVRTMDYKKELMKLEATYYKKFRKVLSPSKVVRYFQIESKINALINAELALEIPLIETK